MHKQKLRNYKTVKVLNVPLTCCSFDDILIEMDDSIEKNRYGGYISITNTESIYHATKIPSHFRYINNADFSCCDGIGVVLAGKIFGLRIPRLHGPDLMLKCCEYGVDKKWRHFFYGGKEDVSQLLSKRLAEKFSGLITAGAYSPPFRSLTQEEDESITEQINNTNPSILWVGLGLLKQEKWIREHLGRIKVPWMIGVGAAFDFHAGMVKRAPVSCRHIGLEWLYRTAFEPRLYIRNLYSLFVILLVVKQLLGNRIHQ